MTFDWADVVAILNAGTVAGVMVAGAVFGWLFFASDRRAARYYIARALLAGWTFAAFMAVSRLLQGAPAWEGWIGFAILWSTYVAGAAVGTVLPRGR